MNIRDVENFNKIVKSRSQSHLTFCAEGYRKPDLNSEQTLAVSLIHMSQQ